MSKSIHTSTAPPEAVFYGRVTNTPAGGMLIGTTKDGALCRTSFLAPTTQSAALKEWQGAWPNTSFHKSESALSYEELLSRPLLFVGTAFQCAVWRALLAVPCGKAISYGDMAKKIGRPAAARAVGNALGKNPIPLIVPCHRVIAGDGTLGGFTGDIGIKEKLLIAERACYKHA